MPAVDAVEFNGITFRRYPESDNLSDRRYYRPSSSHIEDGVEALHREVWKHHNGEIPDGHLIHHKDADPTNNDPDNLELVTPAEHVERHPEMGLKPEQIAKGVEAAKEWHRTDEGREWHRQHAKYVWESADAKVKECEQCGDEFEYYTSARFCSDACKSQARRSRGDDDEERICTICRQPFTINKYKSTSTCSRRCGGALQSWTKRVQSDG